MSSTAPNLQQAISCLSDYDPNALPVADANRVIRSLAMPVSGTETLAVRDALGRVLAAEAEAHGITPVEFVVARDAIAVIVRTRMRKAMRQGH